MCASSVSAETLCTRIIQSGEYPIPMDEREGDRQVQGHVLPGFVAEGDRLAGEGKLADAVAAYAKVFSGFQYRGVYFSGGRCLSKDFYQTAADKLRAVASELAERRRAKGYMLDESHEYGGEFQRGALRLYLTSNQYDEFVSKAFAYAASELRERDIDRELVGLVNNRLDELRRQRERGTEAHNRGLVNDLTPLLDEELAAFDKLGGFGERLAAQLEPLYPKLTDQWLAEEARFHQQLLATDGLTAQMMLHDKARNSLEDGIDRLADHPAEVARLQARADQRGRVFMTAGRFESAEAYFDLAGNEAERARAARLAEQQSDERSRKLVQGVEADVRKMQKSEDEKAAFEKEAEDMAAEFGFDLDE
jgi:hypothetical protein